MAIDERRRLELADAVKRTLGDEAGLTLMEMLRRSAGPTSRRNRMSSRTRTDLTREIETLRSEMNLRFDSLESKLMGAFHKEMTAQTWRLVTAATAMFGLFAAVVRL